jgi:hypothetical protein
MTRSLRLAVGTVLFAAAWPLAAQSSVTQQSLYWLGYFATVDLDRRWYTVGEFQERRWTDPVRVHQRVWRAHLHRRVSNSVTLGAGFTYFRQGVQSPEAGPLPLVNELRPHVQVDVRQPLTAQLALSHRGRLEYRATPRTENGLVTDGYESAGRVRYRLAADWRLRSRPGSTPVVRMSDELHLMFGDRPASRLFDQNRLSGGVTLPLAPSLSVELSYIWWYQKRRNGGIFDRDIWRAVFHHRVRRVA